VPNLTRADLRAFLPQYDLPDQQTDIVILLVRGWLLDATDLEVLPDPLPEVLWGAAVELGTSPPATAAGRGSAHEHQAGRSHHRAG
jgi:hypothetical protein